MTVAVPIKIMITGPPYFSKAPTQPQTMSPPSVSGRSMRSSMPIFRPGATTRLLAPVTISIASRSGWVTFGTTELMMDAVI